MLDARLATLDRIDDNVVEAWTCGADSHVVLVVDHTEVAESTVEALDHAELGLAGKAGEHVATRTASADSRFCLFCFGACRDDFAA